MTDSTDIAAALSGTNLVAELAEEFPRCVFLVNKQSELVFANRLAKSFFRENYSKELELGQSFLTGLPVEVVEHWAARIREAFDLDPSEGWDFRTDEISGCFYEIDFRSMISEGRLCAVLVFEDISERCRKENQLLEMHQALQDANKTRDTIFSILGHDLRSPISQLNALLFLLRQAPEKFGRETVEKYIVNLEDATHHLSIALENLLHWSSLHRLSIEPRFELFDAGMTAQESAGLLRLSAERKKIELLVRTPSPLEWVSDRDMLAYIQRNLVANAIKFSPRGGKVILEQRVEESGGFTLKVQDNGMGMSPEQLEKVRSASRVVSTAGTLGERGLGLGLNLCREFADKLEGSLLIESEEGEGTTVTLRLPLLD